MDRTEANTEAAAPSRPLSLGGAVYAVAQPTPQALAAIAGVVRRRARKDTPLGRLVNDPAFKLLPPECQREAAREAARLQASGQQAVDPFAMMDELMEPETLAYAVWTLCRENHPDLAFATVRAAITEDNAAEVWLAFTEASGMGLVGNVPGASG